MKKRLFTLLAILFGITLLSAHLARPKIIFILPDDLGYGDLNCYG